MSRITKTLLITLFLFAFAQAFPPSGTYNYVNIGIQRPDIYCYALEPLVFTNFPDSVNLKFSWSPGSKCQELGLVGDVDLTYSRDDMLMKFTSPKNVLYFFDISETEGSPTDDLILSMTAKEGYSCTMYFSKPNSNVLFFLELFVILVMCLPCLIFVSRREPKGNVQYKTPTATAAAAIEDNEQTI